MTLVFFSEMSDGIDSFRDSSEIEVEYQDFLVTLHNYFPKECGTFGEVLSNFTSTSQINLIEELSGKVMECVGTIMNSLIPDPIKEILQNKVVSGILNTVAGVEQIVVGVGMCSTVAGTLGGIPVIVNGANMALTGIQELWHAVRGEWDAESVNLIKELTGHKFDNTVDLTELAITMGTAKDVSKLNQQAMSKAKWQLKNAFAKAKSSVQR